MKDLNEVERLVKGIEIQLKAAHNVPCVDADHGVIYGPGSVEDTSEEDANELDELGWHVEEDIEGEFWAFFT